MFMKGKGTRKLKNVNTLLIVAVIIVSISVAAFTGLTIVNTDNLATYTSEIYDSPYTANNAAWLMRARIMSERNAMLNLLIGENRQPAQAEMLRQMYAMRDTQAQLEQTLREQYQGDPETVEKLVGEFHTLQGINDEFIALIRQGKREEAEDLLYQKASPIYRKMEALGAEISDFSQRSIDGYVMKAQELNRMTNQMSIVWGSFLIGLTVLLLVISVRTISRRNADIFHNNMLFSIIAENVDDVFMVYDCVNESVEYLSENAERILGLPMEAFKRNIWIARAYLDDDTFKRIAQSFDREGSREICEYEFVMTDPKTGHEKELVSKRYPIMENGRVTKYVFVTSDLTETKRAQSMMRAALERAEDANAAKREFLSRMSHEIRTPMNAMSGTLRTLEYHLDDPEKAKEYIGKIDMSMKHLLELIGDILDMSKIESGKMKLDIREFSLNTMLGDIAAIMQPKAEENKQFFDVVMKNVTCDALKGDELRIRQVLLNFLSNALKFTPERGKIRMTIEEKQQKGDRVYLRFEVKDTGIGIKEEFLERIFEPFEQEEASTYRKYGGTGLGMPLSKALVESMGGEIEVESVPDMGSIFSFSLWLERTDAEGISIRIPDRIKNMNVLIVEDDKEMRGHLELLCSQLGIKPTAVSSGVAAARTVRESGKRFDLCLIDLYMPDVDGIRTAEWIRSEAGDGVYIALMSAYDYKRVEREALNAGVNDFLAKPVMQADIYRILQRLGGEGNADDKKEEEESFDFTGKRLLVAEDNELNMEIAKEIFERAGFEVDCACNGKEAVEKFEASPNGYYDAILMDIHMPVMNGYEAARTIRALEREDAPAVIILAMTANAFYEDAQEAVKNGMNEHFAKPIDPEAIFASLKKFLNEKGRRTK